MLKTTSLLDSGNLFTEFSGLNQLKLAARKEGDSPEIKRKVAEQFEAIFLQIMLQSMRQAGKNSTFLDNEQSAFYTEMFDQQLSLQLSSNTTFGLADAIYRQLGGNEHYPEAPEQNPGVVHNQVDAPRLWNSPEALPVKKPGGFWEDPDDFINQLYPYAEQAATILQTQPETLLSIAALETGWGKHVIKDQYGNNSFNLFGIKAGGGWQGKRVSTYTLEFEHGIMQKKRQEFRVYDRPQDSFEDFAYFLQSNPRYKSALAQSDKPEHFIGALKQAGYATDPLYDQKVLSVLYSARLQDAISGPIL